MPIDHLGNIFKTKSAMCRYYGISTTVLNYRQKLGWSLKQALETPVGYATYKYKKSNKAKQKCVEDNTNKKACVKDNTNKKACVKDNTNKKACVKDHKGNTFISVDEMCKHWNITKETLNNRLESGISLKDALENNTSVKERFDWYKYIKIDGKYIIDHLGNKFNNVIELSKHWNVYYGTIEKRLQAGWGLKNALETPEGQNEPSNNKIIDHLCHEFKNVVEMCDYWKKPLAIVKSRLKSGWSLKDALEKPVQDKVTAYSINNRYYRDHLGNKFSTFEIMCENWKHRDYIVRNRLYRGWSLKDALETPLQKNDVESISIDHKDIEFRTFDDMCRSYHQKSNEVAYRLKLGCSLKDALEKPSGLNIRERKVWDHLGNRFGTQRELCSYWNIPETQFIYRLKSGWSLQDALEKPIR